MRKRTICTNFNPRSIFCRYIFIFSRTFFQAIQRTITKQAVQLFDSFMTRIIFAVFIGKKTIGIFHDRLPFFFLSKTDLIQQILHSSRSADRQNALQHHNSGTFLLPFLLMHSPVLHQLLHHNKY